jgi:hypothetical protein
MWMPPYGLCNLLVLDSQAKSLASKGVERGIVVGAGDIVLKSTGKPG